MGAVRATEAEVRALLDAVAGIVPLEARLERISAALLGRPYLASSLVGGPGEPEREVSRLDGFDCVTFVETVAALATARAPAGFEPRLRSLRYHGARVEWGRRNHYWHQWAERNVLAGNASFVLHDLWEDSGPARSLVALAGYPPVAWTPRCLPTSRLPDLRRALRAGDLAGFVSNRPDVDAFHVGLLVPGPVVRHASRSRGGVVEEDLDGFLARNDVPGMILVRPSDAPEAGP